MRACRGAGSSGSPGHPRFSFTQHQLFLSSAHPLFQLKKPERQSYGLEVAKGDSLVLGRRLGWISDASKPPLEVRCLKSSLRHPAMAAVHVAH